jgi:putative peptidoglycan lipid II flippase
MLLFFLRRNPHIERGLARDRAFWRALLYALKLILLSAIAVVPVLLLKPSLRAAFAGRSRLAAQGLPLLISLVLFSTVGILLLFITGDKQLRAIIRMIRSGP